MPHINYNKIIANIMTKDFDTENMKKGIALLKDLFDGNKLGICDDDINVDKVVKLVKKYKKEKTISKPAPILNPMSQNPILKQSLNNSLYSHDDLFANNVVHYDGNTSTHNTPQVINDKLPSEFFSKFTDNTITEGVHNLVTLTK